MLFTFKMFRMFYLGRSDVGVDDFQSTEAFNERVEILPLS